MACVKLKNDDGIELHLDAEEKKLVAEALRWYAANHPDEEKIIEQIPKLCELQSVLE